MSYVITTHIDINAPREAVWNVLVDLARYHEWSNFSHAEGTVRVGSRLTLRMPGFSFRPTISAVTAGEKLQWTGTLVTERLFHGKHSFILARNADGTTHLINREEFSGALVTLTRRFMKQNGDNGYTAFNAGLKKQVEGVTEQ